MKLNNFFRVFLVFLAVTLADGCSPVEKDNSYKLISCDERLKNVLAESKLNNFEHQKFNKLLANEFPKYKEIFIEAGEVNDIDWELLAAISFKESQWNPKAKSKTGVRGMMMVTLETAAIVGVNNRLDPVQSINGGAKYFANILTKNIFGKTDLDKLKISLASYNLGPTNIINIASTIDKEPNEMSWEDFYLKLKNISGPDVGLIDINNYTRGQQAIDYVERVSEFYDLMEVHSCKTKTQSV